MRLAAILWFLGACITLTTAAPVPKGPPPAKPVKLTPEMLEGRWAYQWRCSVWVPESEVTRMLNGGSSGIDRGEAFAVSDLRAAFA